MKKAVIKRVKTGVGGFDKLVDGGLPQGTTILLSGSPGTGKSIFALQYIFNGAKDGEKGLYVTFEQDVPAIRDQARMMGWDLEKYEEQGLIEVLYIPTKDIDRLTADSIRTKVLSEEIKRLVVDSISTLTINAPVYAPLNDVTMMDVLKNKKVFSPIVLGNLLTKRFIYNFVDDLRNVDHCTCLLISEAAENSEYLSRDTISEFICDGVILMKFESMGGEFSRSLLVRKMRYTNNDEDIHPVQITSKGVVVHTIE